MAGMRKYQPLDGEGRLRLATAIQEDEAVSANFLRQGKAKAFVAGDPARPTGAVVQWDDLPGEPVGVGSDPEVLFDLLQSVEGWDCVNVDEPVAKPLGRLIEERMKKRVRYLEGVSYELLQPVAKVRNDAVREISEKDIDLLAQDYITASIKAGHGDPREGLGGTGAPGVAAGAVVGGRIVGIVGGGAIDERHADMGAFFLEEYRGRGFGTAAASIVAGRLQEMGLIPTWSTGVTNPASMRLVEKLGFVEVPPRDLYVVLDGGEFPDARVD